MRTALSFLGLVRRLRSRDSAETGWREARVALWWFSSSQRVKEESEEKRKRGPNEHGRSSFSRIERFIENRSESTG